MLNKEHDEARQGEAFASAVNKESFSKHFYIESYGCAMNFAGLLYNFTIVKMKGPNKSI